MTEKGRQRRRNLICCHTDRKEYLRRDRCRVRPQRSHPLDNEYSTEIAEIIAGATAAAVVTIPFDPALEDQNEGEGAWAIGQIIATQ